jgi:transposase-like protein
MTTIAELLRQWRRASAEAMAEADKIETANYTEAEAEGLRLLIRQTVQTAVGRTLAACAMELELAWMSRPEVRRVQ